MAKKTKQPSRMDDLLFYYRSSQMFLRKCVKPNKKEYKKLLWAHIIGIGAIGCLGYLVKLVHIPINNVIVNK